MKRISVATKEKLAVIEYAERQDSPVFSSRA
jgi:hypothetical protein